MISGIRTDDKKKVPLEHGTDGQRHVERDLKKMCSAWVLSQHSISWTREADVISKIMWIWEEFWCVFSSSWRKLKENCLVWKIGSWLLDWRVTNHSIGRENKVRICHTALPRNFLVCWFCQPSTGNDLEQVGDLFMYSWLTGQFKHWVIFYVSIHDVGMNYCGLYQM